MEFTMTTANSNTRFIIKDRYLSDRFINPVTMESSVVECKNRDIIFVCQTSFGVMGSLLRTFTLRVKGKTLDRNKEELNIYLEELFDLRDMLEEVIKRFRWAKESFNFVEVLSAESPLMFQAILNEKEARLNIFGHGLYDMTLHHNRKNSSDLSAFLMRLEDLMNPIRAHIQHIQQIPVGKFKGI